MVLRGVNFDFDKSDIRADSRPVLDEAAEALNQSPNVRIAVEGHTDAVGTDKPTRTSAATSAPYAMSQLHFGFEKTEPGSSFLGRLGFLGRRGAVGKLDVPDVLVGLQAENGRHGSIPKCPLVRSTRP